MAAPVPMPFLIAVILLSCASAVRAQSNDQAANREFQAAVAQYESGHLAEAAAGLENLLHEVPNSFEVHELLGLIFSAQSDDAKASTHFEEAVRLKSDSAVARTNWATNLVRVGKPQMAEREFKKAIELDPASYDANHDLGEFYAGAGKIAEAIPFLDRAHNLNPASYDNGYDLCLAYIETGQVDRASLLAHDLLKLKDTAEVHNLLGEIEEKSGKFVAAENEYEMAAHMDPTESNLFDWASDLLVHRTLDPAVEVFQRATERYPNSQRLAIGLGMALYSRGNYDDAVKALLRAADLNPADPRCYLFLSKAFDSSPSQADEVIEHFRRFAELRPRDARAAYYYALSLWKGKREKNSDVDTGQIESLLTKATELDPGFADAHLQLGNLYSDARRYGDAIPQYERALQGDQNLAEAHYRLAQAYVHTGEKDRAQGQFQIYQQLRAQHLAEIDKQRAEIRQFVYSAKASPESK